MIAGPRKRHGDPLARVLELDGLEEERESLRRAVDGEAMHPFTIARFSGLGWCKRPAGARAGDWLGWGMVRWELTPAGEVALQKARTRWHRIRPKDWWER